MASSTNTNRVGDYELLEKIGEGAMGAVYRSRQISLDRTVALKILPRRFAADPQFVDRFQREARATAKLNHPNIVAGIDVGSADGYNYFAMEFIDGTSLGSQIQKTGAIKEREALRIGAAISSALAHAHAAGIIHRDVKPDNILIARDGIPKLADLGLAKASTEGDSAMTQTGTTVGTPHYMSPEQAAGRKDVDGRADIYSLGCTLYHAATGKTPFTAPTPAVMMVKHIKDKMPHPQSVRADLSENFCTVLERMLARNPRDRYQDIAAAGHDMERILSGSAPVEAHLDPEKSNFRSARDIEIDEGGEPEQQQDQERESEGRERLSRMSIPATRRVVRRVVRRHSMLPTIAMIGAIALLGTAAWIIYMESAMRQGQESNSARNSDANGSNSATPKDQPMVQLPPVPPLATSPTVRPTPVSKQDPPRVDPPRPQASSRPSIPLFSGDSLDGWQQPAPNWTLKNGVLTGQGTNGNAIIRRENFLPPDFELSMDISGSGAFHFGWSPLNGLTNFVMRQPGRLQFTVYKGTPPDNTELSHCDLGSAEHHSFRIEVLNTNVRIYVDGTLSMNTDKGENVGGQRWGFAIFVGRSAPVTFSNVSVREITQFSDGNEKPANDDLNAVIARLKTLNPGLDVQQVQPRIENGSVTELVIPADNLSDISPLRALTSLRHLRINANNKSSVSDISCLRGMQKLAILDCSGTRVSDLSVLQGLPLKRLVINRTAVTDLSALKGMQLESLECACMPISDITPLQDMPLRYLNISATRVTDLTPVKRMPLGSLTCGWCSISDLSPLAEIPTLKEISVGGGKAATPDIAPLRNLPLQKISLNYKPEHAKILHEIKTLIMINGKPANEFWSDHPAQ
jgi:serine/threonine-protein kinase